MKLSIISLALTFLAAGSVMSAPGSEWRDPAALHFGKSAVPPPTPNVFGVRSDPTTETPSGTDFLMELLSRPENRNTVDQIMPIIASFMTFLRSIQRLNLGGITNSTLAPKIPIRVPAVPIYVPEIPLGGGNKIEAVQYTIPEVSYDIPAIKVVPT